YGACEATLSVPRPYAYLVPAKYTRAIEALQRHGVTVDELREDIELDVVPEKVTKLTRATREYQGHNAGTLETTPLKAEARRIEAGSAIVRTDQALGALGSILLEARSEDGLVTWNAFDDGLEESKEYPVVRLETEVPLTLGRVRPLAEDRVM